MRKPLVTPLRWSLSLCGPISVTSYVIARRGKRMDPRVVSAPHMLLNYTCQPFFLITFQMRYEAAAGIIYFSGFFS